MFGPFDTPQKAVNVLHRISAAAGEQIDVSHSTLMATIDVNIDGERHRYQLLKVGYSYQLGVHAEVIAGLRSSAQVSVEAGPNHRRRLDCQDIDRSEKSACTDEFPAPVPSYYRQAVNDSQKETT